MYRVSVRGRYPHGSRVLLLDNIEAAVEESEGLITIDLSDRSAPDFWLMIEIRKEDRREEHPREA
jgi:hypothetical protein